MKKNQSTEKSQWKKPEVKVLSVEETLGGSFGYSTEDATYYDS